jgi:3-deoxy-D-manno-octulosonic-acid transferase
MGEGLAAAPLLKKLLSKHGSSHILFTSMTPTGRDLIHKKFPELQVQLFPLDLLWISLRSLRRWNPTVVILYESELWPNFLLAARILKIPVMVFNGSLSARSYRRFRRFRWIARPLLESVAHFGVQNEEIQRRWIDLGVPSYRISVTGDTKLDSWVDSVSSAKIAPLPFLEEGRWWVAGSVRTGEPESILQAYSRLRKDFPDLRLVLAPRHLDRVSDFVGKIESFGFTPLRRSELNGSSSVPEIGVLVLDTLGELIQCYHYASVVFVGGTLVSIGGHNLFEPALLGKPVLFGPYTSEVQEARDLLLRTGLGKEAEGVEDLVRGVSQFLLAPDQVKEASRRTSEEVKKMIGATDRNLRLLDPLLSMQGAL